MGDDFVLRHENARPHDARLVQWYMEEAWIEVMGWPAVSLDVNHFEQCLDFVKKRIRKRD